MKKILVCGFAGSGKSTFAKILGEKINIEVLHLDSIHFKDGWVEVPNEEMELKVQEFMKKEKWIIDGNYQKIANNRFEECDLLFYFNFNRFRCLKNIIKRNIMYKNQVRPDMASGCFEKLDFEFLKWILFKGRRKQGNRIKVYKEKYNDKLVVFKNRKQVNKYIENIMKG